MGCTVHRLGITDEQAAKRRRGDEPAKVAALDFIGAFLGRYSAFTSWSAKMAAGEEQWDSTSPSIQAALEGRSVETLRKRAGSLRMFEGWLVTSPFHNHNPMAEVVAHAYLAHLCSERAPATRGSTFRETIHWLGALFDFEVTEAAKSSRVRGLALRLQKTRGVLRQRDPLTVSMAKVLEEVVTSDSSEFDIIISGAALFTMYGRARVGDMRRSRVEPFLDLSADRSEGFIQGALMDHKTARPGTRQSLPLVAPAIGISGANWAEAWLKAREHQGLRAQCGTLLPAPSATGGWTTVPYHTVEFGSALRSVLLSRGFKVEELSNIGSHSLKTTTLSWLAKRGVDKTTRKALGYHICSGDRSMDAYSRDALAGPLRTLQLLFTEIRSEKFKPDSTRSGRLTANAVPSSSTASEAEALSSSSADPEANADAKQVTDDEDVDITHDRIIKNASSGVIHIMNANDYLLCGRDLPVKYAVLKDLPVNGKLCTKCF